MSGHHKRKRQDDTTGEGDGRTNQTLPVAELPPDFDGIPLDGAQYLAVVRQESSTVPAITYVANPYAKAESGPSPSKESWSKETSSTSTLMPSSEWRRQFLNRFTNMRETLANRSRQTLPTYPTKIPRGRNGKKWYKFLHGRDLAEEVEYDDDQEEESDREGVEKSQEKSEFNCREPSETLLHHFSTPQIISLLALLPYWLTQPHVSSKESQNQVIDPFHSRWLFALLAHLDDHLVGDDISVLRILARACLACIIQSRIIKGFQEDECLQDEMGAWMIVCAVAGIWGQHDIWEDGQADLERCTQVQISDT